MVRAAPPPPRRTGFVAGLFGHLLARPASTLGGLVMTATAIAILTNALALQKGPHPAPLFVGTRPLTSATRIGAAAATIPVPVASETVSSSAVDSGLIADIQRGLKDFGYYKGDVDGLSGPQTSQAILAFERAFHLTPTGEPSNNVLLAIRSVRQKLSGNEASVAPGDETVDPITVSTLPSDVPLPLPKPTVSGSARTSSTEPVGAAAGTGKGIGDLIASLGGASSAAAADQPRLALATPPTAAQTTAQSDARPADDAATSDPRLALIQKSLAAQGFGPLDIDGRMSEGTRDAIRRFEGYYGLPMTGAISETFLAQLIKVGGLQGQ